MSDEHPKPTVTCPAPPKLFSGWQGFVLIILLIVGLIGWILYINKLVLGSSSPESTGDIHVEDDYQ